MSKFQKGQSGNPNGRPKGSRNKLSEAFCSELVAVWEEQGAEALRKVATEDPATFVRVVASLMPKEVDLDLRKISSNQMTDDELAAIAAGCGEPDERAKS